MKVTPYSSSVKVITNVMPSHANKAMQQLASQIVSHMSRNTLLVKASHHFHQHALTQCAEQNMYVHLHKLKDSVTHDCNSSNTLMRHTQLTGTCAGSDGHLLSHFQPLGMLG